MTPPWQIRVDTGGTFTDCIAVSPAGETRRVKVLSSSALRGRYAGALGTGGLRIEGLPELPAGFFRGFSFRPLLSAADGPEILAVDWDPVEKRLDLGVDRASLPSLAALDLGAACELSCPEEAPILAARIATGTPPGRSLPPLAMRLATTRGTNALLERKGAPVAFFVTEGFADLLAIGTQQRPDLFALAIEKPEPLYARVVEVAERLAADGSVLRPLDREAAFAAARTALAEGAVSAAVALLHAYRDPCHERQLAAILGEAGFSRVATSSELAPEIGFVPRAATAVVEAYLAPVLGGYLERVAAALGGSGNSAETSLLVMTSAGGLARAKGFRAKDGLLSGPAGGVLGAAAAGRRSGFSRLLSFDMGGTSTDVARYDGDFELRFEHRVGDAHLVAPALAVETVAAGGGSICSLLGGQLGVGPESAGAFPGPAAYGAGGPLTITDVNLLLGRLDPARFGIPIDPAAAGRRIEEIAGRLQSEPEPLLEGFLEIANERMADAIRRISIGRGYDPAEYALVAFGGAGAQHACAVAELLGISTVLVPEDASLLSARGLGIAAVERFAVAQVLRPLDEIEGEMAGWLDRLAAEARAKIWDEGISAGEEVRVRRRIVQMRFAGQETALAIEPQETGAGLGPELRARFFAAYRDLYGYAPEGRALEVEALRVVVSAGGGVESAPLGEGDSGAEARPIGVRRARFAGAWREVEVFERSALAAGERFSGPCLIVEALSATVVEPGWQGTKDGAEALVLERMQEVSSAVLPSPFGRGAGGEGRLPYDSAIMEGLTQRPGAAGETADVLLASGAQERARAMAGLERLAFAAIAGGVAAAGVALFAFPAAGTKEPPEAFRAAGTAIPFLAMILILAASRVRGVMLRAARRLALLSPGSGRELTAAYRRAIVLDLVLLEMVAWFGVAMVPLTGSVRYALVIVVAALLGMAVRWPRRSELDALAR